MSTKNETIFKNNVKKLEKFIQKHGRRPTEKEDKYLLGFIERNVREDKNSPTRMNNRAVLIELFERYEVMGKIGADNQGVPWETTFARLEKYLKENDVSILPSDEELQPIFNRGLSTWLAQSRMDEDKAKKINDLLESHGVQLFKRKPSQLEAYLPVLQKALEFGIKPHNLQMISASTTKESFNFWASSQKSYQKQGKMAQSTLEKIGEECFEKVLCCPVFDRMQALIKYDQMKQVHDLETTKKVYLIASKSAGEEDVSYEIATKKAKKPSTETKVSTWKEAAFVINHDIKLDINFIKEHKERLNWKEKKVLARYENINLDMTVSEVKYKKILQKHVKVPFILEDIKNIFLPIWKGSIVYLQTKKRKPVPYLDEITDTLKWNMSDIAENHGISRERIRQVTNEAFEVFDKRAGESKELLKLNKKR